jgi:AraC family transcriptional activator of pobA
MRIIPEIESFFVLLRSPLVTSKKDFVAFRLEDYDNKPHIQSLDCFRTLFYRITFYENESCEFAVNSIQPQATKPHTLAFISPFHLVNFKQKSPLKGQCFCFSEAFINYAFQNNQFHHDFPFFWSNKNFFFIDETKAKMLLALGEKMINEYENKNAFSENIIRDYLHIFLLQSKRMVYQSDVIEDNSADYKLLQQFYTLVNNSYPILRSVETAASILSVTPARLWNAVRKLTAQSPSEIISQRIITEAQSLLFQSNLTISEIGFYLRFKEKSHFTRFFKNLTGISPLEYSRQSRIKK